ncbi:28524_t:CDS:2, partial [Gigaspora margarita]
GEFTNTNKILQRKEKKSTKVLRLVRANALIKKSRTKYNTTNEIHEIYENMMTKQQKTTSLQEKPSLSHKQKSRTQVRALQDTTNIKHLTKNSISIKHTDSSSKTNTNSTNTLEISFLLQLDNKVKLAEVNNKPKPNIKENKHPVINENNSKR